jgi:hypothetical protein
MREAPRGVTPEPSRVQTAGRALRSGLGHRLRVMRSHRFLGTGTVRQPPETLSGADPGAAFGWCGRPGPSGPDRFGVAGMLLSGGLVRRAPRSSGETEGRVLVENLKRVVAGREASGAPTVRKGPEAPGVPSPAERAQKAQEGKTREAGSTAEGKGSGEATENPGEYRPRTASAALGYGSPRGARP